MDTDFCSDLDDVDHYDLINSPSKTTGDGFGYTMPVGDRSPGPVPYDVAQLPSPPWSQYNDVRQQPITTVVNPIDNDSTDAISGRQSPSFEDVAYVNANSVGRDRIGSSATADNENGYMEPIDDGSPAGPVPYSTAPLRKPSWMQYYDLRREPTTALVYPTGCSSPDANSRYEMPRFESGDRNDDYVNVGNDSLDTYTALQQQDDD